jgi:hypothetical protein
VQESAFLPALRPFAAAILLCTCRVQITLKTFSPAKASNFCPDVLAVQFVEMRSGILLEQYPFLL